MRVSLDLPASKIESLASSVCRLVKRVRFRRSLKVRMADDFRIQRYRSADRDCVFALLRAAYSDDFATRLIRQWDWKYDSHPSNREAEQARRINHEKLEPFIIKTYSAETLTEWGLSLDQLDALPDDAPYVLLLKDGDKVVAMEGALPQAF